jgi:hypothetical protein
MSGFQPTPPQKTNGMAIAGFITSILCCAPISIVLSAIGLNQIKADPTQQGKGLALAGLIIGIISVVGGFFYLLLVGIGGALSY